MRKSTVVVFVLAVVVVIVGGLWTHHRWQQQLLDGRAQMLSSLLATSHTPRVIESPGVEAWQATLLSRAGAALPDGERQSYAKLLEPTSGPHLPPSMIPVAERLHAPPPELDSRGPIVVREIPEPPANTEQVQSLRSVHHLEVDGQTVILTRRRSLSERERELGPELRQAAAHLAVLTREWTRSPPAEADGSPIPGATMLLSKPRMVRIYALLEDGSHMTVAFPDPHERDQTAAEVLAEETRQSRRRPGAPSLVTNTLFTLFDYGKPLTEQTHYAGLYADIAGSGMVTTVAIPVLYGPDGLKLILAADLAFDIALERLVDGADPALELALTETVREVPTPMWQPWTSLAPSLPPDAPASLREQVQIQSVREAREELFVRQRPLVHHRDQAGVLFAQQVNHRRWLVGWLANSEPGTPWGPMLVVPGLLLGLLGWAERRRASVLAERDDARARLERRESLADRLGLPVLVVDPNDDTIVHASRAAVAQLGVEPGQIVHERLVADDPRSQAHYHEHQVLSGGRRRTYGVYLRRGDTPRFALVRSVPLGAAIPELGASAHHRLGVVCPLEHDADLALYLDDQLGAARQDERNKLAAILDHGADTLARVLSRKLAAAVGDDDLQFGRWLADYLLARLHLTQWVLERWGGPVEREVECIIGPEHLHAALAKYTEIFTIVAADPTLRAQLHWNNGTLAASLPAGEPPLRSWVDWPDSHRLTMPADGLFGYLLGELLVNAVKHGSPGVAVEIEVDLDRARRELVICVRNHRAEAPTTGERDDKAYGGLAIVTELARLCGWELDQRGDGEVWEQRWRCAVTLQRPEGEVD